MHHKGCRMRERVYLYDAIASNRRRIALGVFVFFAVIFIEGLIVAFIVAKSQAFDLKPLLIALIVAFGATLFILPLLALWAFYRGKQTMLKLFLTLSPSDYDERKLRSALGGVSLAAGVEEPEVQVISTRGVNAISMARGEREGLILVTKGAVENLDREELEALLAHEIYHIESHDTWMWILGLAVSAFLPLLFSAYLSGLGTILDEEKIINAVFAEFYMRYILLISIVFIVTWIALAVFWIPLWITYFILALPRNRDYLADAHAVLLTRNPEAVLSVIKMSDIMRSDPITWGTTFVNHMFFNQPLEPPRTFTRWITDLFNTHPPAEKRAERIHSMG
jgi:heat shock protein HtpX